MFKAASEHDSETLTAVLHGRDRKAVPSDGPAR
jgi:hypothetical protein